LLFALYFQFKLFSVFVTNSCFSVFSYCQVAAHRRRAEDLSREVSRLQQALVSSSSANPTGGIPGNSGNANNAGGNGSSGSYHYGNHSGSSNNGVWQQLTVDLESAVRTLGAPCGIALPSAAAAHVRPAGGWKRFGFVAVCGLFLVAASLSFGNNSAEQAVLAEAISPRRPNSATNGGGVGGGNGVATAVQSEGASGSSSGGGGAGSQQSHAAAVDAVLAHAEKARYRY
jgi:hypothetical protein